MTLSPESLICRASGVFLSGVDTEIDTESRRHNSKIGMIQTMRKVVDGKPIYYQNFVVKEPIRKRKTA